VSEVELETLLGKQTDPGKQGIIGNIHATERASVCGTLQGSRAFAPSKLRNMVQELACAARS
jgi:hypothetical protein